MKIETVPITSLLPDPENVRTHSDRNLSAIAASLKRFGQQKPIVVDGDGIVRAGNGTLAAATALGWVEIQIVRTELKGAEAVAYAVSDNRTGDPEVGSLWNCTALAAQLDSLRTIDADLAQATGFNPEEWEALTPADWPAASSHPAGEEDEHAITCPYCQAVQK